MEPEVQNAARGRQLRPTQVTASTRQTVAVRPKLFQADGDRTSWIWRGKNALFPL